MDPDISGVYEAPIEAYFLPMGRDVVNANAVLLEDEGTAVLLNANARRVSPLLRRRMQKAVAPENLYLTKSLEEAEEATREILARGYRRVLAGGGDGTLSLLMDQLCRTAEAAPDGEQPDLPAIGVLKLGTGNALASHVGSGRVRGDLEVHAATAEVTDDWPDAEVSVPLHLIEASGRLSFFAGAGVDAMILNDYMAIKKRLRKHFARLGEGVGTYLIAAFGRTVPRLVTTAKRRPDARIINRGRPAYLLDSKGLPLRDRDPIPTGGVLYEGPLLMASAGTLPYYGAGMVMFPWACDRAGHMQLRIANPPVSHVVSNIKELWAGTYDHDTLMDFHVTHVSMEFDEPFPIQVAGDAEGWSDTFEMKVSPHTVPLVHLN